MTQEEITVFENITTPNASAWWLPVHWFSNLVTRAKKEGRISDPLQMNLLHQELLAYRSSCGTMFGYDWISVPLVYTQVVTLAVYTYFVTQVLGHHQYLESSHPEMFFNEYFPLSLVMQFFFYVGWLKVAEQLLNPYGDDDDDFELNWCIDRNIWAVFNIVDTLHRKHPKLKRDVFWGQMRPKLPYNRLISTTNNAMVGSAAHMDVNVDEEFLPLDAHWEQDVDHFLYSTSPRPSIRDPVGGRSFSTIRQSLANIFSRRSSKVTTTTRDSVRHSRNVDRSSVVTNRTSKGSVDVSNCGWPTTVDCYEPGTERPQRRVTLTPVATVLNDDDDDVGDELREVAVVEIIPKSGVGTELEAVKEESVDSSLSKL